MTAVLSVTHAGAVICVFLSGAPLAAKLLWPLPVAASAFYCIRRYALLKHSRSPRRLLVGPELLRVEFTESPDSGDLVLRPGTVNTRAWVILRGVREGGKRLALTLAPDMMERDQWRRLRVWLTVSGQTDTGDGDGRQAG